MPSADLPDPPATDQAPRAALVMLAAGEGRRSGSSTNKVLLSLAGRRVFTWSIRWARLLPAVHSTTLVIREDDREEILAVVDREVGPPGVRLVVGGDSRHASEWQALQSLEPAILAGEVDVVVIHDAARPLAGSQLFEDVIAAAMRHGGALPVREQSNLVSLAEAEPTPDQVVAVQTPQAFAARPLLEAYRRAAEDGFVGTDTASCMERYADVTVACVPSDAGNLKITFPDDLFLAERLLAKSGFDLSGGREHPHRRQLRDLLPGTRR